MTLLRKILKPFGFPQYKTQADYTLPWGLSEAEWRRLQKLVVSEDFQILIKTLDNVVNLYAEHLLGTEETEKLHYLRGKIAGVRYAVEIVDETHKKEQDFLINGQPRREDSADRDGRRRLATFGTPAWSR